MDADHCLPGNPGGHLSPPPACGWADENGGRDVQAGAGKGHPGKKSRRERGPKGQGRAEGGEGLRAQAQNKSAALSAQLEEAQRQAEEAREEGRREEREAQRIPIPAVNAEKALEREIGRISSSLGDSLPVLLECIRFTGSQEMVNDILGLSDDLEETAKELKGAAIAARNNSFLTRRDEEEDFSWLEE